MGFQNIKPKKSLGQNFFQNHNLAKQIVELSLTNKPKGVVEIGPGKGIFTEFFLEKNIDVVAIEKDDILAKNLKAKFPNIKILHKDILDINLDNLNIGENNICFGSLPYNISKKIISNSIQKKNIKKFYFIIQKEVAEKYCNQNKSSLLSLQTQLYANTKILMHISPQNFSPKPNVESSLIHFKKHSKYNSIDKPNFIKYLQNVFSQPRKKIKNNLCKHYKINNIDETTLNKRPENLNLEEHIILWQKISL